MWLRFDVGKDGSLTPLTPSSGSIAPQWASIRPDHFWEPKKSLAIAFCQSFSSLDIVESTALADRHWVWIVQRNQRHHRRWAWTVQITVALPSQTVRPFHHVTMRCQTLSMHYECSHLAGRCLDRTTNRMLCTDRILWERMMRMQTHLHLFCMGKQPLAHPINHVISKTKADTVTKIEKMSVIGLLSSRRPSTCIPFVWESCSQKYRQSRQIQRPRAT